MAFKTISVLLSANSSGLVTGLARAGVSVKSFESQVNRSGKASADAGKLFTVAKVGALGLAAAVAYSVKSAAQFQSKMNEVKAVSGASAAEMQTLSDKALQLGKDTVFSASDAADAIGELVKAGVSVQDVMHGAADATVALAAAGGISLPEAATIAANAMNAFKLSAAQLPHVADLIAGAANASAIDVNEFGMSFQQVSAVAHLAGISLEDTTTAIAELGNAGIKGSDAGTSLKTMLQYLQPQTKQAANEMKALGIITETGGNRFYDAAGKAKSLSTISEVLHQSLEGLTKQQQQQALATLFGSDAIRAASVLAQGGARDFDKLSDSIGKVKAADVAKTRMQGLSGAMQNLQGSVETAAIQFGSHLLPALTSTANVAASTLVPALSSITELLVHNSGVVLSIATAWAAWKFIPPLITALDVGLTGLSTKIFMTAQALTALGGGSFALGAAKAIGFSAAIIGVGLAFQAAAKNAAEAKKQIDDLMHSFDKNSLNQTTVALDKVGASLKKTSLSDLGGPKNQIEVFEKLSTQARTLRSNLDYLSEGFGVSKGNIEDYARAAGADLTGNLEKARVKIRDYLQTQIAGTPATRAAAQALLDEAGGAQTAAQKIDDLKNQIKLLGEANSALIGDQDAVTKGILTLKESLDPTTASFTDNTLGAITNREALRGVTDNILTLAQAQIDADVPYSQVTAQVYLQAQALLNATGATGQNRDMVAALIAKLLQMPPAKATNVSTPGAVTSAGQVNGLLTKLQSLRDAHITVTVADYASAILADIHNAAADLATFGFSVQGSTNTIKASRFNADGGHYAQIGNGITRVWNEPETGGEAYIPLAPSKRSRSIDIWQQTGKSLGVFADGGIVQPQRIYPNTQLRGGSGGTVIAPVITVHIPPGVGGADSAEIKRVVYAAVDASLGEVVDLIDQRVGGKR